MAAFVCVTQSLRSLTQTNSVWKFQSSRGTRIKATALQTQKAAAPVRGVERRGVRATSLKPGEALSCQALPKAGCELHLWGISLLLHQTQFNPSLKPAAKT